jgi:hypothetical protein
VAEPEDSMAESGGREGESGPGVDTGRPKDDSDEPAEHEEAESTPEDAESSDDETDPNNGSTEDADGPDDLSADDGTDDDADNDDDANDRPEGHDAAEAAADETDSSDDETADDESGDDEDGDDEDGQASGTGLPRLEPVPLIELMAAYRQPATAGGERLPWSWATLSPAERVTSATVLDGFVESYNRTWAISNEQTLPPCWHRHPALAHDLAALAWAYYQAYRDPTATPDRALQFQADLVRFAERIDRWLGGEPGACRAGRHPTSWRDADGITRASRGSAIEDTDAVTLLGEETFGFGRPTPAFTD